MGISKRDIIIEGSEGKPILVDISYIDDGLKKTSIIFSHGFKDFKDYNHYNKMAKIFALAGFNFIKLNFSHNGTIPELPDRVSDMNAFANNNFSKELFDLNNVITWASSEENFGEIYLLGHSRGGGISIIQASEDKRIKKLATWGAPINFENKIPPEAMDYWKQTKVIYVENTRTKQTLPLNYQIAEDYFNNLDRINILKAVRNIRIPFLIAHGTEDEVVNVTESKVMKRVNSSAELLLIQNADHYFGIIYPQLSDFPEDFNKVLQETIAFFKR